MLSNRALNILPSPTLAISAKAKALRKEGKDVVDFGVGEPDFDTPKNIKDAAINAINSGFTKYTPASGTDELKEAICRKLKKDNKLDYGKENIVVSCGGKHALYNIMLAMLNKDDEVIIPTPCWVSYAEQVKLADGKPVFCETGGYKIKADLIADKISDKTKLAIINSPSNPTGMLCDKSELKKIADLAVSMNFYVISDDVYEKFVYDGKEFHSIAAFGEEIKKKTIIVNAVSKTYSMTGWRIGYSAANPEITKAMANIQSQTTSNPTSISQKAALEALNGPQESVGKMLNEFDKRRKYMVKRLNEIEGITCVMTEGAFYAFQDVSESLGKKVKDANDFTNKLLEKKFVAVVPGDDFIAKNNIRLSYATSMENIEKGLNRIEEFLK